jgi:hypothetical protein
MAIFVKKRAIFAKTRQKRAQNWLKPRFRRRGAKKPGFEAK